MGTRSALNWCFGKGGVACKRVGGLRSRKKIVVLSENPDDVNGLL